MDSKKISNVYSHVMRNKDIDWLMGAMNYFLYYLLFTIIDKYLHFLDILSRKIVLYFLVELTLKFKTF